MRRIFTIPDDLDQEFIKTVYERFGMKKGNINKAAVEALQDWINKKS